MIHFPFRSGAQHPPCYSSSEFQRLIIAMDEAISSAAVLEYLDKLVPCWCKLPAVVEMGRQVPSGLRIQLREWYFPKQF
jgi:hypothetical protein